MSEPTREAALGEAYEQYQEEMSMGPEENWVSFKEWLDEQDN